MLVLDVMASDSKKEANLLMVFTPYGAKKTGQAQGWKKVVEEIFGRWYNLFKGRMNGGKA